MCPSGRRADSTGRLQLGRVPLGRSSSREEEEVGWPLTIEDGLELEEELGFPPENDGLMPPGWSSIKEEELGCLLRNVGLELGCIVDEPLLWPEEGESALSSTGMLGNPIGWHRRIKDSSSDKTLLDANTDPVVGVF